MSNAAVQVAVEAKMAMDVENYATSFRPDIIDAVSGWCQGATFAKVLTLTDVFEVRPAQLFILLVALLFRSIRHRCC